MDSEARRRWRRTHRSRPVLITIHTYCPHILPIPGPPARGASLFLSPSRSLSLAVPHPDYITTYGEHKLLWLPFYEARARARTRVVSSSCLPPVCASSFFARILSLSLPLFLYAACSCARCSLPSTFVNYEAALRYRQQRKPMPLLGAESDRSYRHSRSVHYKTDFSSVLTIIGDAAMPLCESIFLRQYNLIEFFNNIICFTKENQLNFS